MKGSAKKRIYVVGGKRLVRASTSISARNHVAKDTITSEVAGQDVLLTLVQQGVKVEEIEQAEEVQETANG
jgi:hypothetical protein